MGTAVAKVIVNAIAKNRKGVLKYYASKLNMKQGQMKSLARKVNKKSPKAVKMTAREKMLRSRRGQST
tara:strand:+ start:791 stop:994 length:204 start_codon:yes stop_codon:yes gene_type:complete